MRNVSLSLWQVVMASKWLCACLSQVFGVSAPWRKSKLSPSRSQTSQGHVASSKSSRRDIKKRRISPPSRIPVKELDFLLKFKQMGFFCHVYFLLIWWIYQRKIYWFIFTVYLNLYYKCINCTLVIQVNSC